MAMNLWFRPRYFVSYPIHQFRGDFSQAFCFSGFYTGFERLIQEYSRDLDHFGTRRLLPLDAGIYSTGCIHDVVDRHTFLFRYARCIGPRVSAELEPEVITISIANGQSGKTFTSAKVFFPFLFHHDFVNL